MSSPVAHEPNLVPDDDEKSIAAIRFLDNGLFLRSLGDSTPSLRAAVCVPSYIKQIVLDGGSPQRIVTSYYQSVHQWLPIVCKRKVYERLINPLLPARVDSAFLLLCMSLLASSCTGIQDPDVLPEYCAAIRYCMEIQRSGLMTPEILQGCILLSVYEWSHAIYPAADLSMSMCLRYALSLGMGWKVARGEASKSMWADGEEERRTWWAIYILERFVHLHDLSSSCAANPPFLSPSVTYTRFKHLRPALGLLQMLTVLFYTESRGWEIRSKSCWFQKLRCLQYFLATTVTGKTRRRLRHIIRCHLHRNRWGGTPVPYKHATCSAVYIATQQMHLYP